MINKLTSVLVFALLVSLGGSGAHVFSGGSVTKGKSEQSGTRNITGGEGVRPEMYLMGGHGTGNSLSGGFERGFADGDRVGHGIVCAGFEKHGVKN
ncbi:hypothetical protein G8759_14715 [Spirosoma aureum]|uniref:Uncharacterized protein n=1 Tax=Spirosoma aureum TaxID=2692134 RepID=A0A6G9AN59_9BACT|nr:hypothetical protein [Spirosoma aureum]QIP13776.1 hypothetical protein G8759_14715 [Spirosoma aureum]